MIPTLIILCKQLTHVWTSCIVYILQCVIYKIFSNTLTATATGTGWIPGCWQIFQTLIKADSWSHTNPLSQVGIGTLCTYVYTLNSALDSFWEHKHTPIHTGSRRSNVLQKCQHLSNISTCQCVVAVPSIAIKIYPTLLKTCLHIFHTNK